MPKPKEEWKLQASACSLEGIEKMITRYLYGNTVNLHLNGEVWDVYNPSGKIEGYRVISRRGRYRFEVLL